MVIKRKTILYACLIVYISFHIFTLANFPFVHSDEAWLASLSRSISVEKSLAATEDFYHITPRYPHAIKSIYHLIQIPFICAQFSVFAARLPSLIAGLLCLYFIYKISVILLGNIKAGMLPVLMTAVDIQFIYMSHMGRQEIFIAALLYMGIYYFLESSENRSYQSDIILGIITSAGIGIHPNSFLIGCTIVLLYCYFIFIRCRQKNIPLISLKNMIIYIAVTAAGVVFFISLSFIMDPQFPVHFLSFGSEHGVTDTFIRKIFRFRSFYIKLYKTISGTYYLPEIKYQLWFFGSMFLTALSCLFIKKYKKFYLGAFITVILAFNLSILFIGKFSPPSIGILFPAGYLLSALVMKRILNSRVYYYIGIFLLAALCISSGIQMLSQCNEGYRNYISEIKEAVPADAKVLANLNTAFAFNYKKLHVYRDLASLEKRDLSFEEYIRGHSIDYIIYPEEMDVIYQERPVWNTVYGNIFPYYDDMQKYLKESCSEIYQFTSRVYGMRIVPYMNRKDWTVRIYKVVKDPQTSSGF